MAQERIFNVRASSDVERDWTISDAFENQEFASHLSASETIDLREPWWDIGNQGQTGSCVGWAVADSLLRWHFTKRGQIREDEHLSARFIWMAAKETDSEQTQPTTFIEKAFTSIKAGLEVVRKFGAVLEEQLPFNSPRMYSGTVEDFYMLAGKMKISAYYNLDRDLDNLKIWLEKKGPVLSRLIVDNNWLKAKKQTAYLESYGTGEFEHAAVFVGYTPDAFIVRNSWGVEWGDEGYALLSPQYASRIVVETYGVVV